MTNKKIARKSKRSITINYPNYFEDGGKLGKIIGAIGDNLEGLDTLLGGGLQSGAGSAISNLGSTVGSAISTINPLIGGIVSIGSQLIGGATNALFGSKLNEDNIASIEASNNKLNNLNIDSSNNQSILDQWSTQDFGQNFSKSDIGRDGLFSNKASDRYNELQREQTIARNRAMTAFENAADISDMNSDLNIFANYSAYGGPLYIYSRGGKIHIKPSKRGTFTEAAKRRGMGVQEFANKVLANKDNYSTSMVKKANFARNASKWKHAYGGSIIHGGDFSNGVTFIDNGGTHEENPMEGVLMGIAPDGTPNLVEEGEVKYNNYVFSNRLFADKKLLEQFKLPTSYANHSYAYIAEKLSKESSERPNDPISKGGLEDSMTKLTMMQEIQRNDNNNMKTKKSNKFDSGGNINTLQPILTGNIRDYLALSNMLLTKKSKVPETEEKYNALTALRYAPAIGSGINVITDMFGITNEPDYSNAELIGDVANTLTKVDYTPIGNYLTYRPLDRNYYTNKLGAQAGATRRAIVNQSGGNRAVAMAGLLSADNNAQARMGDLARQAEEYNQAQRERVAAFNRGTNQLNTELALRTDLANQANDRLRLQAKSMEAQLRENADIMSSSSRSANLTNFLDNMGNIGREEVIWDMIKSDPSLLYDLRRDGNVNYKTNKSSTSNRSSKSKGGYLTIRKR